MTLMFGKYPGTHVQYLVLGRPDYISWMLSIPGASGPLREARNEAIRLIKIFDAEPLQVVCNKCGEQATRWSLYPGAINPFPCCDDCDPASNTFSSQSIVVISTYREALSFVASAGGSKSHLRRLIQEMAQAKGLPGNVTERRAVAFFNGIQ